MLAMANKMAVMLYKVLRQNTIFCLEIMWSKLFSIMTLERIKFMATTFLWSVTKP